MGIAVILLCFLTAAVVVFWNRGKARKTMETIEKMLDAAMDGSFSESGFDESKLSALERGLRIIFPQQKLLHGMWHRKRIESNP